MAKSAKKNVFRFTAPIAPLQGSPSYTGIFLPAEILEALPRERVRAKGTMNKIPFALAVQYRKAGDSFFMVSAAFRRTLKVRLGDPVDVEFELVDADIVELPEELEAVLAQDEEASDIFGAFKPGMQRSLSHYVSSAKGTDTRIKRALELAHKMKTRTLNSQKQNKG